MYQLAFDTSNERIVIGLARDWEVVAEVSVPAHRASNQRLLPEIDKLLKTNGVLPGDLEAIGCGRGPGSFTGVRIALATAKGICSALKVPLVGISTLDAVALNAAQRGYTGELLVIADAMRGEVYPVKYQITCADAQGGVCEQKCKRAAVSARSSRPHGSDDDSTNRESEIFAKSENFDFRSREVFTARSTPGPCVVRLNADMVCKPAEVKVDCPVCGDGLVKFKFDGALSEEYWYPTGRSLIALMKEGTPHYAGEVLPVYTRLSDAEETEIKNKNVKKDLKTGVQGSNLIVYDKLNVRNSNETAVVKGEFFVQIAGAADEAEIVELEQESFSSDAWKSFDGSGYWLKATVDGKLVGYAGGTYNQDAAEVLKVCIKSEFRKQGIAKKLLSDYLEAMRNLNVPKALLEVRASNEAAIALYKSLGFSQIAVRKNFYGNEDALSFELNLADFRAKEDFVVDEGATKKGVHPLIFAIESSCDETAASIVDANDEIVSSVVSSSAKFHARFGGVVPEIASRKHIECISYVADEALALAGARDYSEFDAIAVTAKPGLVGSLVVGCAFAKGVAWAANKPLIFVDHLIGHLFANKMCDEQIEFPCVASLISGGNTMLVLVRKWGDYEVLGGTIDDAVGEAFDKIARAFGLPYPGGPEISALAKEGDATKVDLPRPMLHSHDLRMSLSGLKTAVMLEIEKCGENITHEQMANICAAFEESITDVQVAKAKDALLQTGAKTFCFGGGVAANKRLRAGYESLCKKLGVKFDVAPFDLCGDNASMIGLAAQFEYKCGNFATLEGDVSAKSALNSRVAG